MMAMGWSMYYEGMEAMRVARNYAKAAKRSLQKVWRSIEYQVFYSRYFTLWLPEAFLSTLKIYRMTIFDEYSC